MYDSFNRKIHYLRLSLTSRCNFSCQYCMPECQKGGNDLPFEQAQKIVAVAAEMGVDKIRLTGGEPLLYPQLTNLIKKIKTNPRIKDLSLTTNGSLLQEKAQELKDAGLTRINISLDTIDPTQFKTISGTTQLQNVLSGIQEAKRVGFSPIKINCVIAKNPTEPDASGVSAYAEQNGLMIRFIREMDLKSGLFFPVIGGEGGVCQKCNRIRVTAQGIVKPCLFRDDGYDINQMGIENSLERAIINKPEKGQVSNKNCFYEIGG